MNIFFYTTALVSFVSSCNSADNNPVLNKGCNYAGTCVQYENLPIFFCICCSDSYDCGDSWVCDQSNQGNGCVTYDGGDCTSVTTHYYAWVGIRLVSINPQEPADITCSTIPKDRKEKFEYGVLSTSYLSLVTEVVRNRGWNGTVVERPNCDTCSPAYPCETGIGEDVNATDGVTSAYQVDFNEYYDVGCSTGGILADVESGLDCEANFDNGQRAYKAWIAVEGNYNGEDLLTAINNQLIGFGWTNTLAIGAVTQTASNIQDNIYITMSPTRTPTNSPTENPTPYPTFLPTITPTTAPSNLPTTAPSNSPTSTPTIMPSVPPTISPSLSPTSAICAPYTNDVESIAFVGVGANCRAGLNMSWPGELSCDSPYIVCLPQENTPATYGGEPYQSSTHRYSISECKQECANDQRCVGLEFVADVGSSLGDCNLIDDFPMEITDSVSGFTYNRTSSYTNLDSTITNGDAMCFGKADTCVPYFEADELNEAMLDCYCPNNRKGYYTKKVKRTVSNTRFCGSDFEVDRRIKKAQANRMFHLCENWCLFQTKNPEAESWYWDPWKTCWREQYAGVGEHMSYCTRVIRNPDTIEMQFVNRRSSSLCQTPNPTAAPVLASPSWFMAQEEESCDDACIDNNMVCHEDRTANVTEPNNLSESYFADAGVVCSSIAIGELDWALPGYKASTGACFTRNIDTENTECNYALGVGYKRLCACISGDQPN